MQPGSGATAGIETRLDPGLSAKTDSDTDSEAGRRARFEAIAAEVYEPLQRFLRRRAPWEDAEELFDDVLLTIWRRLDDVPADSALPWSYGVAHRLLANRRRAQKRNQNLIDRLMAWPEPPPSINPVGSAEDHPEVAAALDRLPASLREVLVLWAWEELEPREIAVVLDATPNAISLRLTRARSRLAREIARQNPRAGGHELREDAEEHRS